jgi:hypothetical protein
MARGFGWARDEERRRGAIALGDLLRRYRTAPQSVDAYSQAVESALNPLPSTVQDASAADRSEVASAVATMSADVDQVEQLRARLPELLTQIPGSWVCVRNGRVEFEDAAPDPCLAYGRRTYAGRGFIVAQIVEPLPELDTAAGAGVPPLAAGERGAWTKAPPAHRLRLTDGRYIPGRWFA